MARSLGVDGEVECIMDEREDFRGFESLCSAKVSLACSEMMKFCFLRKLNR